MEILLKLQPFHFLFRHNQHKQQLDYLNVLIKLGKCKFFRTQTPLGLRMFRLKLKEIMHLKLFAQLIKVLSQGAFRQQVELVAPAKNDSLNIFLFFRLHLFLLLVCLHYIHLLAEFLLLFLWPLEEALFYVQKINRFLLRIRLHRPHLKDGLFLILRG